MRRDKYFYKSKEYRALLGELDEINIAQCNLGYVKLETPIPHGYVARFKLRDDIARRDDAWVFQGIINLCGKTGWRRKNTFKKIKDNGYFHTIGRNYYGDYPDWKTIDKKSYDSLVPQVKKWFSVGTDKFGRVTFRHNVPYFYFEIEVEHHYRTESKVIDESLEQREAEIENKLWNFRHWRWNSGCAPSWYCRFYNVSDRRQNKLGAHKFIREENENFIFPGRHKHCATWDWW